MVQQLISVAVMLSRGGVAAMVPRRIDPDHASLNEAVETQWGEMTPVLPMHKAQKVAALHGVRVGVWSAHDQRGMEHNAMASALCGRLIRGQALAFVHKGYTCVDMPDEVYSALVEDLTKDAGSDVDIQPAR